MTFPVTTVLLSILILLVTLVRCSETPIQYANHLFNAVHSSMRQFGSSLNHNGMSLFIATVPEGTEFYHGTDNPYRVNTTEWLAFEPEHALLFVGGPRGPPGPKPPKDVHEKDGKPLRQNLDQKPEQEMAGKIRPVENETYQKIKIESPAGISTQKPLLSRLEDDDHHGYLHTYRAKHSLRLLYLDGQSAAKSNKGTLDVQDLVLLYNNPPHIEDEINQATNHQHSGSAASHFESGRRPKGPQGPMGDAERALGLCNLAQKDWKDRIDGILRMEGGFEIILCDFAKHLDIVSIAQTADDGGGYRGFFGHGPLTYYQAVAARYDGIGGDRVSLNYNDFVSLYAVDGAMYFDDAGLPRVDNGSTSAITKARSLIDDMVFREHHAPGTNWQSIADMIIGRYANRIETLTSGRITKIDEFKDEVYRSLRPFIDYRLRNRTAEAERCANQFLPSSYDAGNKASQAVRSVAATICRTFSAASTVETTAQGVSMLTALRDWLGWTEWKKCRGCASDEVCFLPIWPMGNITDFERPRCVRRLEQVQHDYWLSPE